MRHLPGRLIAHVEHGAGLLDVGCSDGRLAHALRRLKPTITVTGVDVVPQPDTLVQVVIYNGAVLPFADDTFHTVMLVDVLHHDLQPERLLGEAMRVARRRVLIKDHYWVTPLDRQVLAASDYLGNRAYGIALPYNYLRREQWRALFAGLQANVVYEETFRYSIVDRCKQIVFVVDMAP